MKPWPFKLEKSIGQLAAAAVCGRRREACAVTTAYWQAGGMIGTVNVTDGFKVNLCKLWP